MTIKDSARRLARMTDKDLMITCGGGYGKQKQETLLADLRAVTDYTLGERDSARIQILRSVDEDQPA